MSTFIYLFFLVGGFAPHIPHRACTLETRFRIENPSQNRLVSTAYFAKPVTLSLLLLLTTAKYKIGHNSKTKNHMQKSQGYPPLTHFFPPFQHLLSERLTSLGIMGEPRVPPLNPSETIVLSEHYRL